MRLLTDFCRLQAAALNVMHKGYHADEVVRACQKMYAVGMKYILNFLGGLGGHNYGFDNAQKSAEVINQTHHTILGKMLLAFKERLYDCLF